MEVLIFLGLLAAWLIFRAGKPSPRKPSQNQPPPPGDARTLRRYTPKGTQLTDYVIPCSDCGWNTAVSRSWVLANDTFICPRCGGKTNLIKSTNPGPGAITDEFERITKAAKPASRPEPPEARAAFLSNLVETERQRLAEATAVAGPEPAHALDEADHPAPRKRGRPRKPGLNTKAETKPEAIPTPAHQTLQTLVSGLKLPVQFEYSGGHVDGERQAVIVSACGQVEPDGNFDVTVLRCICVHQKMWRAFRLDRMSHVADLTTGEMVADPKAWITQKLNSIA